MAIVATVAVQAAWKVAVRMRQGETEEPQSRKSRNPPNSQGKPKLEKGIIPGDAVERMRELQCVKAAERSPRSDFPLSGSSRGIDELPLHHLMSFACFPFELQLNISCSAAAPFKLLIVGEGTRIPNWRKTLRSFLHERCTLPAPADEQALSPSTSRL